VIHLDAEGLQRIEIARRLDIGVASVYEVPLSPTARRRTAEIIRLKEQGVTPTEIATRLGIGRASVYRILGEQFGEDRQQAA
jgi:DNA-binding CsgD family transcriptional regulator